MESESSSIDPRYRPEFQRGYRPKAGPMAAAGPPVEQGPDDAVAQVVEVAEPTPVIPAAVRARRNPYLAVIAAVGVATTGLGAWLTLWQAVFGYGTADQSLNSMSDRFGQTVSYVFAAPFVTVGLAMLAGLGFLIAARRRP